MTKRALTHPVPDALSVIGVLAATGLVIAASSRLPSTVPIHFGISGDVNGYGGRGWLLFPVAMSIATLCLFSVLRRFPQLYNLPAPQEDARRPAQEALASEMIAWLGAVLSWNFFYVLFALIRSAQDYANRLSLWTLPLILGAVAVPVLWFLSRLHKQRQ